MAGVWVPTREAEWTGCPFPSALVAPSYRIMIQSNGVWRNEPGSGDGVAPGASSFAGVIKASELKRVAGGCE